MQVFCFVVVNGLWHLEHFLEVSVGSPCVEFFCCIAADGGGGDKLVPFAIAAVASTVFPWP